MKADELNFNHFEQALDSLEQALRSPPKNDLERDGVIQRFEYTFEMAWKSIQKLLKTLGRPEVSASPKPILRDALEEHLIDGIEPWFAFLEARNNSTHTYNRLTADQVHQQAMLFPKFARDLLKKLKDKARS